MPKQQTDDKPQVYRRKVGFNLDVRIDRALELMAADRQVSKSEVVEWALLRVAEVRGHVAEAK